MSTGPPPDPKPTVTPPPLPIPVLPLEYFRPAARRGMEWVVAARCRTPSEWHSLRQALSVGKIDARMNDAPPEQSANPAADDATIELLVDQIDLPRAQWIIELHRSGRKWCPHCGSISVRHLPTAWYWYVLAIFFLGLSPFWPASNLCESCGRKWG